MVLSNEDARTLVELVPVLIEWIRYKLPTDAGDVLVQVSENKLDETSSKALYRLFLMNRDSKEWNLNDLRKVLTDEKATEKTWASCLWHILQSLRGILINDYSFEGLEETNSTIEKGSLSKEEIAKSLSFALMRMSYISYAIVEELCLLIKETTTSNKEAAEILGPKVFIDKKLEKSKGALASKILKLLVDNSDALFGEVKCSAPFGIRNNDVLPEEPESVLDKQAQQLKHYFEIVDKNFIGSEHLLLEHFYLADIAHSLYVRYSCIPSEWLEELNKMDEVKEWFSSDILTEKSKEIQSSPCKNPPYFPQGERPGSELAVDEVYDSEIKYFNKLNAFLNKYVDEVARITSSATEEEREAMLMKEEEIRKVFGEDIKGIRNDTSLLLRELEIVNLMRIPRTKSELGRPGIVAEILFQNAEKLKSTYAPYNGQFPKVQLFVKKKVMLTQEKTKKKKKYANFLDIWNQISMHDKYLSGFTIEQMIMEPIQRYPRYVILLKTLESKVRKEKGKDHPDYSKIMDAWKFYAQMTDELDKEIKRQRKILEMRGDEETVQAKSKRLAKKN